MVKTQKTPQQSKARLAVKKYGATTASRYDRKTSRDNPGWREGGSGNLDRDVATHKALRDSINSKGGNWPGSSIASIKHLREANNVKKCGGGIRRKKSK